jgi:hypothetical protein
MKKIILFSIFFCSAPVVFSQDWTLQVSSNVEIRTWKLTTKADKEERPLGGATIVLTKGTTVVSKQRWQRGFYRERAAE